MPDHNEQFFASFGSAFPITPPMLAAGRNNLPALIEAWSMDLNRLGNPRYTNVAYVTDRWESTLTTATRNFQQDRGLVVDGKVGKNTRAAMTVARAEQGQRQSRTDMALANLTPLDMITSPLDPTVTSTPSASSPPASGSAAEDQALAEVKTEVPFMETPLFEGGPSRGKALGFGALFLGSMGLIMGLITTRR